MIIITSLLCNQKCPYCFFYKTNSLYTKNYLNIKDFSTKINKILEKIYEKDNFYDIRFFWAEQLLNDDIDNLIYNIISKLNKNKKINIYLNTNLTVNIWKLESIINKLSELSNNWYNINFEIIITFSSLEQYFMDLRWININNYIKLLSNVKYLSNLKNRSNNINNLSINIINNYVIDIKKILKYEITNNDIIKDIETIKKMINIKYFNILPLAYNYIWEDKEIKHFEQILKKIKEYNNKNKILANPNEYFEQYIDVNNKYYVPLYPWNVIVDFYWNISYNLVNYEDFWLLNFNIDNINNLDLNKDNIDILNIDLNNKHIPKQYEFIINKLDNKFWNDLLNNTDRVYKLSNKILYN